MRLGLGIFKIDGPYLGETSITSILVNSIRALTNGGLGLDGAGQTDLFTHHTTEIALMPGRRPAGHNRGFFLRRR